jgi:Zn-dependent M28 family amino/carboxypeptidase
MKRAADRIGEDIDVLAGTIGERNVWRHAALERAAAYIGEQLQAAGLTPTVQEYPVEGVRVRNIEAALAGSSEAAQSVVIGAHYDTVIGCPGANDNGTGVAAMLELARRFADRPPHRHAIRFVAFANEESPFFQTAAMGSLVYAREGRRRGHQIAAMLSLETMGYYSDRPHSQHYPIAPLALFYPNTGNFIAFVSNIGSARLLRRAYRAFRARTSFPVEAAAVPSVIPGIAWSDHWSFWQVGCRAIMVTDTAPYRYPWYHTIDDTPDKVSLVQLADVVDGLEQVVQVVADSARA